MVFLAFMWVFSGTKLIRRMTAVQVLRDLCLPLAAQVPVSS